MTEEQKEPKKGDKVAFVGADGKHATGVIVAVHNPPDLVDVQFGPPGFEKTERVVSRKGKHAEGKPYWYELGK